MQVAIAKCSKGYSVTCMSTSKEQRECGADQLQSVLDNESSTLCCVATPATAPNTQQHALANEAAELLHYVRLLRTPPCVAGLRRRTSAATLSFEFAAFPGSLAMRCSRAWLVGPLAQACGTNVGTTPGATMPHVWKGKEEGEEDEEEKFTI